MHKTQALLTAARGASLARNGSTLLLRRLLEAPDLVARVRQLAPTDFAALVQQVGVEDAGELVALATTEQLVTAFDETLFVNEVPGKREAFSRERFVTWLQVLLEAGEAAAAKRFVELSEDFVVFAFSSVLLVLDDDALRERLSDDSEEAHTAGKVLESSLSEELDGYLLVALDAEAWDALLALVLALDRDQRAFLTRILDRCVALSSELLDDLEQLTERLTDLESLAEDVEAERESRRSARGFVEPRAARSFLALARQPLREGAAFERDAITRTHLGAWHKPGAASSRASRARARGTDSSALAFVDAHAGATPSPQLLAPSVAHGDQPLRAALELLREWDISCFSARLDELVYLANTLVAGAIDPASPDQRFRPEDALQAALCTVALGAQLVCGGAVDPVQVAEVLREHPADELFRRASSGLAAPGLVRTPRELDALLSVQSVRGPGPAPR